MGEVADMYWDGLLCEICHECIDGESPGYPRKCDECMGKRRQQRRQQSNNASKVRGGHYTKISLDEMKAVLKEDKGWYESDPQAHEYIFAWRPRTIPNIEIKVATSINKSNSKARSRGKDAIRVWAIWSPKNNPKNTQGLVKSVRVNRTPGWEDRLRDKIMNVLRSAVRNTDRVEGASRV